MNQFLFYLPVQQNPALAKLSGDWWYLHSEKLPYRFARRENSGCLGLANDTPNSSSAFLLSSNFIWCIFQVLFLTYLESHPTKNTGEKILQIVARQTYGKRNRILVVGSVQKKCSTDETRSTFIYLVSAKIDQGENRIPNITYQTKLSLKYLKRRFFIG